MRHIKDVHNSSTHVDHKVAPSGFKDHNSSSGHVLASMVTGTFKSLDNAHVAVGCCKVELDKPTIKVDGSGYLSEQRHGNLYLKVDCLGG